MCDVIIELQTNLSENKGSYDWIIVPQHL